MDTTILLMVLAVFMVLVGLAGTFLPVLPGVALVFAGLVVAAWAHEFQYVGVKIVAILGALTALALAIDFVASVLGAKCAGASKQALWGATIGSVVGLFFGLIGIFIFPFVGAVVGELAARSKAGHAAKVGVATWLGLLFGTLAKLALALTMIGIFIVAWLWR